MRELDLPEIEIISGGETRMDTVVVTAPRGGHRDPFGTQRQMDALARESAISDLYFGSADTRFIPVQDSDALSGQQGYYTENGSMWVGTHEPFSSTETLETPEGMALQSGFFDADGNGFQNADENRLSAGESALGLISIGVFDDWATERGLSTSDPESFAAWYETYTPYEFVGV